MNRSATRNRPLVIFVVALACPGGLVAQGYPIHTIQGSIPSHELGRSVAAIADLDGDGTPDVLVGGRDVVRVISGASGGVIRTLTSPNANPGFGASVASTGDIDGDGQSDILVGAPTGGLAGTGFAYLFSGATGATLVPFSFPFSPRSGESVAGLGDVNQDGVPDFAISGSSTTGVTVYSGATSLPLFSVALAVTPVGVAPRPVAAIGDVNLDGFADVLVGVPSPETFAAPPGAAAIFSGATGLLLRAVVGSTPEFGLAVAALGDVSGDGIADFAVGAPRIYATGLPGAGSVGVYSGATAASFGTLFGAAAGDAFGSSISGIGDLDGDGVRDMLVGAPGGAGHLRAFSLATGQTLFTLAGAAALDALGGAVAGAGDLNGDGAVDLVVGAKGADQPPMTDTGQALIMSYAGIPAGSTTFGSGCSTPSGAVPSILTGGGGLTAATGNAAFRVLLTKARPSTPCALVLGFSSTSWGTIPLPLDLAVFGMSGCSLLVSADLLYGAATTAEGKAAVHLPLPASPVLAGATAYLQWYVVDPGPATAPGVLSAALQATVQ